jgi:hypothetical protein
VDWVVLGMMVCFLVANWLAIHNNTLYNGYDVKDFTVEQFVIVSLDLGTETYNHYWVLAASEI